MLIKYEGRSAIEYVERKGLTQHTPNWLMCHSLWEYYIGWIDANNVGVSKRPKED